MRLSHFVIAAVLIASPVLAEEHSTDVVLSEGTTQKQIDDQVRAYQAYGQAAYSEYARAGGCNADFLPVEYAAQCWRKTDGSGDANPTGGQIGASSGGSE